MGSYHIRLRKNASNLLTIILLWENYRYKHLPIGIANSPDILQQKMNYLSHEFKFIPAYINGRFRLLKMVLDISCTEVGINA